MKERATMIHWDGYNLKLIDHVLRAEADALAGIVKARRANDDESAVYFSSMKEMIKRAKRRLCGCGKQKSNIAKTCPDCRMKRFGRTAICGKHKPRWTDRNASYRMIYQVQKKVNLANRLRKEAVTQNNNSSE